MARAKSGGRLGFIAAAKVLTVCSSSFSRRLLVKRLFYLFAEWRRLILPVFDQAGLRAGVHAPGNPGQLLLAGIVEH